MATHSQLFGAMRSHGGLAATDLHLGAAAQLTCKSRRNENDPRHE
jgi:hypothetical protein